ncbi:MAG: hypothetical protein MUF87_17285 [Anaerolineae bacterium]|jgi:hypothetical protein|nr:hypothetical protein [Anaerolineae bacterium]
MFDNVPFTCPRCQIGRCKPGTTTLTRVLQGQVINLPDVKHYRCDVCGFEEIDREALQQLDRLLGASGAPSEGELRPVAKSPSTDLPNVGKAPRPKA